MTEALGPLIGLLGGENGHAAQALAWIGAARIALKPLQGVLLGVVNKAIDFAASSTEKDDDNTLLRVVGSKPYRASAFALDLLASVKLPNTEYVKERLQGDEQVNTNAN